MDDSDESRWSVYVNFARFERICGGPAIPLGLLRCGVWADRLSALTWLAMRAVEMEVQRTQQTRDTYTVFFLGCGCLHELGAALRSLEEDGVAGLLPERQDVLGQLREVVDRWEGKTIVSRVRDKAGFHVDQRELRRGFRVLARLLPPSAPEDARTVHRLFVAESEHLSPGRERTHYHHEVAVTALLAGLFVPRRQHGPVDHDAMRARYETSLADLGHTLDTFWPDLALAIGLVSRLMLECLEGAQAGRRPTPLPRPPRAAGELEQVRQAVRLAAEDVAGFDNTRPLPEQVRQLGNELKRLREQLRTP